MNRYFILGGSLAVVLSYGVGYWMGEESGQSKVQAQWNIEKARLSDEYAKNIAQMRQKEQDMQASADKLRQEKGIEISKLNARSASLLSSLRQRPERTEASGMPKATSAGQDSCTGKELYREDGEFLVRIAREADEIREALKQCYAQYDSIGR